MGELILDPIIPFVGPISGGKFTSKKLVKLQAKVSPNAYGFDINFQCGPNTFPHDDIALQISVRLLNGYIGLNSMENGIWGKETRLSNVLIEANQKFEIIVLCEFNQYKIFINNEQHGIFPQRICSEKVTHLGIDGDVSIIQISYESICGDLISDQNTSTSMPSIRNQFYTGNNSNKPPSYESAVNGNDDVESQALQVTRVAIFHFQRDKINRVNIRIGVLLLLSTFAIFGLAIYASSWKS